MNELQSSSHDHTRHELTAGQKTGFVLLLVFAILVVGVGFLQMRNTIYNPFAIRTAKEVRDLNSLIDNETLLLQSTDTDGDGLFDYDELTFYETSPYLPDTDSDGIADNVELEQGSDPLCPEGSICALTQDAVDTAEDLNFVGQDLQDNLGNPVEALEILSGIDEQATETQPTSPLSEQDPAVSQEQALQAFVGEDQREATIRELEKLIENPIELREFLVSTGDVTAEQLADVDDQQLMAVARQLFAEQFGAEEAVQ